MKERNSHETAHALNLAPSSGSLGNHYTDLDKVVLSQTCGLQRSETGKTQRENIMTNKIFNP
jgi:hypothetical protein